MEQLTFIPEVEKEKKIYRETCLQCGGPIPEKRQFPWTKYCSQKCSDMVTSHKRYPDVLKHTRTTCLHCNGPISKERQGVKTKYCSLLCNARASRLRMEMLPLPPSRKNCLNCGKPILNPIRKTGTKFCGLKCATEFGRRNMVKVEGSSTLQMGTLGAIGEYIACVDLLRKGYEVFRSVSPTCSCDLVILKDGKLETVEVRVGAKYYSGCLRYSQTKIRADLLAIVLHDEIIYKKKTGP